MYAQLNEKSWGQMGQEWDVVQDMYTYMKNRNNLNPFFYQLLVEKRMFATQEPPFIRVSIVKFWYEGSERKREVMVTSADPEHIKSVLMMLISIIEDERKRDNDIEGSVVP
jgi:hypothetical protein